MGVVINSVVEWNRFDLEYCHCVDDVEGLILRYVNRSKHLYGEVSATVRIVS